MTKESGFCHRELWSFHRQYASSLKEIFMNFPEDNQKQQAYIRYKRESKKRQSNAYSTNRVGKMKYIEKNTKSLLHT